MKTICSTSFPSILQPGLDRRAAAIIGCGVAGPVLAMALQKVGYSPIVYEAHPEPREDSGAFLTLAPNGLNALAELGLRDDVIRHGHPCEGLDFHNEAGRRLGRVDGSREQEMFGACTTLLRRAVLVRVLREAAVASGVPVEFGRRLAAIEQAEHGVTVTFEDGTKAGAGLAIGCDGVFSRTRRAILPEAPAPRYTGLLSAGGFAPRFEGLAREPRTMRMHFGRNAFFGYYAGPRGEVFWFSNAAVQGESRAKEICSPVRRGGLKEWIGRLHEEDVSPIPEIVAATGDDIGCWPIYELPPLPSWSRESVCLVGDAAHATSPHAGQGASLAIEDSIALASSLAMHGDPACAFASFEADRRDRVERLVAAARRNGQTKTTNPVARWMRDRLLPIFIRKQSMDWVYSYRVSLKRAQSQEA